MRADVSLKDRRVFVIILLVQYASVAERAVSRGCPRLTAG